MPIYAYRCAACGHAKDVLQKMSDPLLTVCPSCGKSEFKKQVTAAGFQLKGSGWYVTDFKGGSGGTAAPAVDSAVSAEAKSSNSDAGKSTSGASAAGTSTNAGAGTGAGTQSVTSNTGSTSTGTTPSSST